MRRGPFHTFLLLLSSACATTPWTSTEHSAAAQAALARGDHAAAMREADAAQAWERAEFDRTATTRAGWTLQVMARRNLVDWTFAEACIANGRLDEARDTLLLRFANGNPDAMWRLLDVFAAQGTRQDAERWLRPKPGESEADWSRHLGQKAAALALLAFANGDAAAAKAQLLAAIQASAQVLKRAGMLCLLGDICLREGDHAGALERYRQANKAIVESDQVVGRAPYELRLAKAAAGLGDWDAVAAHLAAIDNSVRHAPDPGHEITALRVEATEQSAVLARKRGDLPQPPTGLTLLAALDRLQGLGRVDAADGGMQWRSDGDEGCRIWLDRDGAVHATVAGSLSDGDGCIPASARDATDYWDPRARCFDYGRGREGPEQWRDRLVLFANGDLFVGRYAFEGRGVYLSPTRPPYAGLCCFGMPRQRAFAITAVTGSYQIVDDEYWLEAELANGSTFQGAGVRDGDLLVPTRYACFVFPGRGAFVGWFAAGKPREGAFFHLGDQLDLLQDGSWYLHTEHHGSMFRGHGKWDTSYGQSTWWLDQFVWRPGRVFRHWDRQTGIELVIDNTLFFSAQLDAERLAAAEQRDQLLQRGAEEQRRRDAAAEARRQENERRIAAANEEFRRTHPNWQQEREASERQANENRLRAFSFAGDERSTHCVKCSGAGAVYRAGGASQQWVWDTAGSGSWRQGTVHDSGSMVPCPWCGGSGRR